VKSIEKAQKLVKCYRFFLFIKEMSDCEQGLTCSNTSKLPNTCLNDAGEACVGNSECANDLYCIGGVCGCNITLNVS